MSSELMHVYIQVHVSVVALPGAATQNRAVPAGPALARPIFHLKKQPGIELTRTLLNVQCIIAIHCIMQYSVLLHLISTWRMATVLVPTQFRPLKSPSFLSRSLHGKKGEKRNFFKWQQFKWLHYDVVKDVAFCYLCMKCQLEKKFLASTKWDQSFISRGFTYWKESCLHSRNMLHRLCNHEDVEVLIVLLQCTKGVEELQSKEHTVEKEKNRKVFTLIPSKLCFLAWQGLAIRGQKWF